MKKAIVGILPMLAGVAADREALLTSSDWGLQRKYDGERLVVSIRRNKIVGTNRKGEERPISAVALASLQKLVALPDFSNDRETLVDCEIMGDEIVMFDIITLRDNDLRKTSFEERYSMLEILLEDHRHLLAEVAWTEAAKRAMIARGIAEDWEGFIHRLLNSQYVSGVSNNLLKDKLWATCTCRVLTVNKQRSIGLGLLDEHDNEVFVGNVTVPVNQDIPEPDALVNVRYLYALEGGSLYQPVLQFVRDDVDKADRRADVRKAPPEKQAPAAPASISDAIAADAAATV